MKIIDAHLHLFPPDPRTDEMARGVGHENSVDHLRQVYGELEMVHGVVMGNRSLEVSYHNYPSDLFHYCVGLDSTLMEGGKRLIPDLPDIVEEHLKREACCGVKLYPGYNRVWLYDPMYEPIYQLCARYDKPVAIHMGLTAYPRAHLKYCHPLVLDEVAADHKRTRFVMCHFGNPFLESAAAVVEKNPNVATDLSGLLEGRVDLERYFQEQAGYVGLLRTWLTAICQWDDVMYGTDWPIVNLGEYIRFIQGIVPQEHWEQVFFHNANRIYGLGLEE
ncbi:amidohydrolase family protein [Flavonifractor sp. An100]|uniref:amidohydrolase family protein n=1 Tax=Flavonifractor sp. An100 TaxID=1965538 RepID=UPI000B37963E|nr:amidohydrolase family protein [Flavonifractor sp. An100]OUQ78338.1 amidohydrolase [Flavonifractor sp. An100]